MENASPHTRWKDLIERIEARRIMLTISQEQVDTLRSDLKQAQINYDGLKGNASRAESYWLGRLEALTFINNLIGFSEE